MFFLTLMICFMACGSLLMVIDWVMPNVFFPIVLIGMKMIGLILIWTGAGLYIARSYKTGGAHFLEMADPSKTLLLNIGNSGAKILKATKGELNSLIIRGKNRMRLKDMGHSIWICGHELQIACQTVNITLPLPILDAINRWKSTWNIKDKQEFKQLYNQIKDIKTYADVEKIPMLKPVMADPEKRKHIFDMSLDDIRNLRELLFTGKTIDATSYLDWDETANPYDNESIINRQLAHRAEQRASYRWGGATDWGKIVIPLTILLIVGAIAYQIFMGGG